MRFIVLFVMVLVRGIVPFVVVQEQAEIPVVAEEQTVIPMVAQEQAVTACSIEVRCDTLPQGRTILSTTAEFTEGESVFDVLLRELRNKKIPFEFVSTPGTGAKYIEGIDNIYEFDGGELSGWIYKVNGERPNVSCSQFFLKNGDKVELLYSLDLGRDVD